MQAKAAHEKSILLNRLAAQCSSKDLSPIEKSNSENYSPLYSLSQFSAKHPAFTVASLRWLRFNAKPRISRGQRVPGNGFAKAFVKVGRRVFVAERAFLAAIEEANVLTLRESY